MKEPRKRKAPAKKVPGKRTAAKAKGKATGRGGGGQSAGVGSDGDTDSAGQDFLQKGATEEVDLESRATGAIAEILRRYKDWPESERPILSMELEQIADAALEGLIHLAEAYEDADAVRWLAWHSNLETDRIPQSHWLSVFERVTQNPKANAIWQEAKKRRRHAGSGASTSPLMASAWGIWCRLSDQREWENQLRKQRWSSTSVFGNATEWASWLRTLIGYDVPISIPEVFAREGTEESAVREVIVPFLKWLQKYEPERWKLFGPSSSSYQKQGDGSPDWVKIEMVILKGLTKNKSKSTPEVGNIPDDLSGADLCVGGHEGV